MEEKRRTVHIECRHLNGLMIALYEQAKDDLGAPVMRRVGAAIRLNGPTGVIGGTNSGGADATPGITEVDGEWWDKWVDQNKGKNPLLDQGVIGECKEFPTPPRPLTGT